MQPETIGPGAPRGPFTMRTAQAAGLTHHALRGLAWKRITRGVWIAASEPIDRGVWVEAARLVLPIDGVLCGLSAATVHGVDVRAADDLTVHVAFDGQISRQRPGMMLRQVALRAEEVEVCGRWLVTTPIRTAFDCGRWLPIVEAVVVVDAMAHAELIDLAELEAFAKDHSRVRGLWRVVEVARLADPLSESPMETRLRLILVFAGLPRPVSQLNVFDSAGRFVARLDLAYEEQKVAVEYDGTDHWAQRRHDDRRRDALRALGWTVLVFSAEDVYRRPTTVARQVEAALLRASRTAQSSSSSSSSSYSSEDESLPSGDGVLVE
jgi:hypothetical protein